MDLVVIYSVVTLISKDGINVSNGGCTCGLASPHDESRDAPFNRSNQLNKMYLTVYQLNSWKKGGRMLKIFAFFWMEIRCFGQMKDTSVCVVATWPSLKWWKTNWCLRLSSTILTSCITKAFRNCLPWLIWVLNEIEFLKKKGAWLTTKKICSVRSRSSEIIWSNILILWKN